MFQVDPLYRYRVSRAARNPTKIVRLVPVFRVGYLLDAWLLWRPRLNVWDAYVVDPSMRPIAARMARAARFRTASLFDAAGFAASLLADPNKFYSNAWRQYANQDERTGGPNAEEASVDAQSEGSDPGASSTAHGA